MGNSVPITDAQRVIAPIARSPFDLLLQDLSPKDRLDIKYCMEFMRLIPSSPALLHTVLSIAALHQSQRILDNGPSEPGSSSEPGSYASSMELQRSMTPEKSATIYETLKHKQLALKHIRN
ncbi:fungal-specific transcription factor domain-containing protein [Penicillium argentinense]|uniref:Fungal-specific transcription factor domain-containing protein n=1 Tax=Penicillium argentinense TaxID=1131581 RepID=A0A9W9ENS8_9EURO|nr:fungal-specific transcription factor domain-containing protein [Penicillium argentinense]KAJ5085248.1 fungal-specific transcription factor domain-containing protein [Penicillium argentinense]